MEFIKNYWLIFALILIYNIIEKIMHKHFNKLYFNITVIIIGVVGLIFYEGFSIGYNIDMFFVCIISFSIVEILRIIKEKRNKKSIVFIMFLFLFFIIVNVFFPLCTFPKCVCVFRLDE